MLPACCLHPSSRLPARIMEIGHRARRMRTLTASDSLLLGYWEGAARRPGVAVAQVSRAQPVLCRYSAAVYCYVCNKLFGGPDGYDSCRVAQRPQCANGRGQGIPEVSRSDQPPGPKSVERRLCRQAQPHLVARTPTGRRSATCILRRSPAARRRTCSPATRRGGSQPTWRTCRSC
jgi:hypothetical protein